MGRSSAPSESRQAGHTPVVFKINLDRLAALLFLVQAQEPHVGSCAAGEGRAGESPDVVLALLRSLWGSRPGPAPRQLLKEREGPSLSSTHTSPARQRARCWHLWVIRCPAHSLCLALGRPVTVTQIKSRGQPHLSWVAAGVCAQLLPDAGQESRPRQVRQPQGSPGPPRELSSVDLLGEDLAGGKQMGSVHPKH